MTNIIIFPIKNPRATNNSLRVASQTSAEDYIELPCQLGKVREELVKLQIVLVQSARTAMLSRPGET